MGEVTQAQLLAVLKDKIEQDGEAAPEVVEWAAEVLKEEEEVNKPLRLISGLMSNALNVASTLSGRR